MRSSVTVRACVALMVVLTAGVALAGECKAINVRAAAAVYLEACEYQGFPYEFCIDTPLNGTINGTWHYYGQPATRSPSINLPVCRTTPAWQQPGRWTS